MKKKIITSILILFLLLPLISISTKTVNNRSHAVNTEVLTSLIPSPSPFIYGSDRTPVVLDPVDCWDSYSKILIDQVAETLFTYNFSDPSLPLIPLLATGYDLEPTEKLNFTIYLRQGVIFHDGSEFNSTVAKWNFDRMEYWWNFTGLLPDYEFPGYSQAVYYWEDGILPVWNRTEILDAYTIKFVLNKPHVGFIHLLTYVGSAMLSMKSTPFYSMLVLGTDQIIGTGPYVFDYYIPNTQTNFHAFENYWREEANIEELVYVYYPNDQFTLNMAMLTHDIDFISSVDTGLLDTFKADPVLNTIDNGNTSSGLRYITFNHNTLNNLTRKALSYAINYTDVIERILDETVVRLKSPLPAGMLYSNDSFDYPYFNITKARQFMQNIGHGVTLDPNYPGLNETEWELLADTGTYNFSMWAHTLGGFYDHLFDSCKANFRIIGINIFKKQSYTSTLLANLEADPNWLDIWPLGWMSDYNDPSNNINFMLSTSPANGNVNDTYLQNLMDLGLQEFDPVVREGIYDEIQRYVVEELMPKAWLCVPKMYHVHHVDLTGFTQNFLNVIHFYDYKWKDSYSMSISSSGDTSFIKGSTGNNLTWTITSNNITNPQYDIYINDFLDDSDIWQNNTPIVVDLDGLPVGTYEFKIKAYNTYKTAENIVNVEVNIFDISHPPDINYTVGDTGNTISWVVTSTLVISPTYYIYQDNVSIDTNSWSSGSPIEINIDGLSVGTYEYRIEVHNSDVVIKDFVTVNVEARAEEIIPGFSLLFVLGITSVSMIYIYKKSKKKLHS